MSDESQLSANDAPKVNSDGTTGGSPAGAVFRLGNVLKIVVPVVIILGCSYVFFGRLDGVRWITNLTKPSLVSVSGKVLFNGEPLPQAEILTQPLTPGLHGGIGTTDDGGRFSLVTEVDGDFLPGAYAGKHQVTVIRRHNVVSFGPAPAMTPPEYAAFETSPLQITVSKGQDVELRLEGKASEPPPSMPPMTQQRPANATQDGRAKADTPPP